eukprot:CAMPEP_0185754288 /NCGR_PEP_ID=MMETSP1174-20130828/12924_1 /TAXON_ID=35687 /ORGANISM="Dictyocha speculum, Strain CCMP1381" /LENGTH=317 /DNA_ID=CAMNT_0028432431 /DNA_START=205 /DNA_END=1158 /DNA_ORIENTATION=-
MTRNGKKKKKKNSRRRISDAASVTPWQNVNADIVCEHGMLARACAQRAKRRVMEPGAWNLLHCFYPDSQAFAATTAECHKCVRAHSAQQDELQRQCHEVKIAREAEVEGNPLLKLVLSRRTGSPNHLFNRNPLELLPLLPGLYKLVSHEWLRSWRHYTRSHKATRPPPPDLSLFLCEAHQLPLIPPHLRQFLCNCHSSFPPSFPHLRVFLCQQIGFSVLMAVSFPSCKLVIGGIIKARERDSLLLALDQTEHQSQHVCEVVTEDEYDALLGLYPNEPTGLSVGFAISDHGIEWATAPCTSCDAGHLDQHFLGWRRHK